MHAPAVWRDDPACGHTVAQPYQTHYCSYIRTPRLLTLQNAGDEAELALVTAYQWYELWFKVLLVDLRAALASDGETYEAVKLLKRGLELFRLFDQHADLAETMLVRDLRATRALRGLDGPIPSAQLREILQLAEDLPRLAAFTFPGLAETADEYGVRLRAFRERYERLVEATLRKVADGLTPRMLVRLQAATRLTPRPPLLAAKTKGAGQERGSQNARDVSRGGGLAPRPPSERERSDAGLLARSAKTKGAGHASQEGGHNPRGEGKQTAADAESLVPDYAEWVALDMLLSLQEGVKAAWCCEGEEPLGFWKPETISPDENMFIIVHQCFELWFKVVLDQVDRAIPALLDGRVAEAMRRLRRTVLIQRLLVPQIQMPATMLSLDFMRFRSQKREHEGRAQVTGLSPASGTESYQFREIEIVCGLRDDPVFQRYLDGSDKLPVRLLTPRQRERLKEPTLPEAFRAAVNARGVARYDDLFTPADQPNPHLDLALLADTLLEFDEFFRFWRLGHVSMVEKMIGNKSGTGFLGPEYLAETTGATPKTENRIFEEPQVRRRFFEELWEVRGRR